MGMIRQPRNSALNAVFASSLLPTRIVLPIRIFRRFVSWPSSSTSLLIAHMIHLADALPSWSREPSDAASMSLPSRSRCINSSNPPLSGGKSVSIRWKACCCIWSLTTTRCLFAWTNASNAAYMYCCIRGLIICAASLIFCGGSTSGRLLCSMTRMVPRH